MAGDTAIIVIQPTIDETLVCTPSGCTNDEDLYKLECAECKRLVHYICTQLPVFQIHLFLTKGYRKFVCANCVDVPQYLLDIVPKDEDEAPIPSHTKTMAELTAALKHNAQESDKHKISNIALTNIQNQLREELSKQVELSKNGREELTRLQTEITEYENSLNLSKENEAQLKNAIVNQQKELKDQEEKFMEAGNPDFDAITKLEDTMKTKLDQIGTSLKEFLLKELHENNIEIEEKMNIVMAQNRTYAESVQNTQPSGNVRRDRP